MFKPAPHSLFAILLRNPWWISLGIALLLALAARALLPDAYWIGGALGGFPFIVIAAMSFVRQMKAPKAQDVAAQRATLQAMHWRDFESAIVSMQTGLGWQRVSLDEALGRPGSGTAARRGDGAAADLAFMKGGQCLLVSARRFKAATHGEDDLAALGRSVDQAREVHGLWGGLYLALGVWSPAAAAAAQRHGITVQQGDALARWWWTHSRNYQK